MNDTLHTLTLTPAEQSALVQIIDLAVKAGGLNVAEAAVVLARKVQSAPAVQSNAEPAPPAAV